MADLPVPAIPEHVAVIMDGNGRWAKSRMKPRIMGHKAGRSSVEKVIRSAYKVGVKTLSLFAFSIENWTRPSAEVTAILQMIQRGIIDEAERLRDEGIRIRILGRRDNLPKKLCEKLSWAEEISAHCDKMQVIFAINYSGKWAIVETAKKLAQQVANGEISASDIDDKHFSASRPMPDLPKVDLLIRSSGELRVSNFHLWEIAYAELYFTNTLWPDFDEIHFQKALDSYQNRDRRFGGIEGTIDNVVIEVS